MYESNNSSITIVANDRLRQLWARSEAAVLVDGIKIFQQNDNVAEALKAIPVAPHYGFYLQRTIERGGFFPGTVNWQEEIETTTTNSEGQAVRKISLTSGGVYHTLAKLYEKSREKKLNITKDVPHLRGAITEGVPLQRKSLFNWGIVLGMDPVEFLKMLNAYDGRSIDVHDPRELLAWYCLVLGAMDKTYNLARFESLLDCYVKAVGTSKPQTPAETKPQTYAELELQVADTYTKLAENKVEEIIKQDPQVRDESMIRFMVQNCDNLYKVNGKDRKYYSITYANALITLMKYAYLVWNELGLDEEDAGLSFVQTVKDDKGNLETIPVWFKGFLAELPSYLDGDDALDILAYVFDQEYLEGKMAAMSDAREAEAFAQQSYEEREEREALKRAAQEGPMALYLQRAAVMGKHIEAVYRRCKDSENTDPVSRNDVLFASAILLLGLETFIRKNGYDDYQDHILGTLDKRLHEPGVQAIERTVAELLNDEDLAYWFESPAEHTPQARYILTKRYFDNILREFNMFEMYPPHPMDKAVLAGFLVDEPLDSGLKTIINMSELLK